MLSTWWQLRKWQTEAYYAFYSPLVYLMFCFCCSHLCVEFNATVISWYATRHIQLDNNFSDLLWLVFMTYTYLVSIPLGVIAGLRSVIAAISDCIHLLQCVHSQHIIWEVISLCFIPFPQQNAYHQMYSLIRRKFHLPNLTQKCKH